MLLIGFLNRFIRKGRLELVDPDGRTHVFGEADGRPVRMLIHDKATMRRLFFQPKLALGEAYMDGKLIVENAELYDLIDLLTRNLGVQEEALNRKCLPCAVVADAPAAPSSTRSDGRARTSPTTTISRASSTTCSWTPDRQYSCAYFPRPDASLEEAQHAKKRHIAAKLRLTPGQRVLDIGSGWGGLGLYIAQQHPDVEVVGVTLSREQHAVSNRRAEEMGLADRVRFELQDYRTVDGPFDRIVSVGMFEHVGMPHYQEFFDKVHDLLAPDGVALLHTIGRIDGPGSTNPWIRKYIFPGGYCPALSEVMPPLERTGMWTTDVENPAPALCRHAAGLAGAVQGELGPRGGDLRRAVLQDVGILSLRQRNRLPQFRPRGVPDPDGQEGRHRAGHPRLHVRIGAPHRRARGRHRRLIGAIAPAHPLRPPQGRLRRSCDSGRGRTENAAKDRTRAARCKSSCYHATRESTHSLSPRRPVVPQGLFDGRRPDSGGGLVGSRLPAPEDAHEHPGPAVPRRRRRLSGLSPHAPPTRRRNRRCSARS